MSGLAFRPRADTQRNTRTPPPRRATARRVAPPVAPEHSAFCPVIALMSGLRKVGLWDEAENHDETVVAGRRGLSR